ncbi:FtsX-like permease family protein [uncultured Clostridium sp.]|uniref:ABC transporter permease n=1 Tax=uncultured Clostridium sp. TaxID=59620 RepID=UPI002603299A|nr:FtsX-like permease family protein [uncultured Clostridium sp.]
MKISDGISIGIKDLYKRKVRSILTGIAIAVGCMLLVAMQGIGDTINKTATSFISSFGDMSQVMVMPQKYDANNNFAMQFQEQSNSGMQLLPYTQNTQLNPKEQDNEKAITASSLESMSKITGVKNLSVYEASRASNIEVAGTDKQGSSAVVLGYNPKYLYTGQGDIIAGSDLNSNDANGILVRKSYLENMGIKDFNSVIGKKITLILSMPSINGMVMPEKKVNLTIKGVYENKNSYYPGSIMTFENITNEMQAYYTGTTISKVKPNYSMVTINTTSDKYIDSIMKNINTNLGYSTFNLGEVVGLVSVFTGFVRGILDIGAIIVIIVASVGLINTMTMTIGEKKKWIGIMRSIGAKRGNIKIIFLAQAIFIGILGAIAGCILAIIAIFIVNIYLTNTGKDITIMLTSGNVALGFIVTVVVSAISGILPARKAAKLDVIEIINEE